MKSVQITHDIGDTDQHDRAPMNERPEAGS